MFLFIFIACSTLNSPMQSLSATDTASTAVCDNTGIGMPVDEHESEWMTEYPLTTQWLVLEDYFQVTAECLTTPLLIVSSDSDGEWPLKELKFYVVGGPNDVWVTELARAGLTITADSGEVGEYTPDHATCDDDQCEGYWQIDLTEAGVVANSEDDSYMSFDIEGFDDPESIDELWDDEFDSLVLLVSITGDHTDDTTGEVAVYQSISWTGMVIEPIE